METLQWEITRPSDHNKFNDFLVSNSSAPTSYGLIIIKFKVCHLII